MNDVRELLGRVAEDAGQPIVSTEAVYARAARVRWRRRAAVSAAALAVVALGAAGAVALPGLSGGTRTDRPSVAASTERGSARAEQLSALLPPSAGTIEQVSLAVLLKQATPEQAEEEYVGPLDGQYAVRRDGGVGYLTLSVMDREHVARKFGGSPPAPDLCAKQGHEPLRTDCVREELPDGRVLTVWSDSMDYGGDGGTPQWGPELVGRLTLPDGSLLAVRSSTGYVSDLSQGPLLTSPALSREQLRTLMLRPQLMPAK